MVEKGVGCSRGYASGLQCSAHTTALQRFDVFASVLAQAGDVSVRRVLKLPIAWIAQADGMGIGKVGGRRC